MALQASDMADLVVTTLDHLPPASFNLCAQELQNYEVMGYLLKKENVMVTGGRGIEDTVMTSVTGTAKHVGLWERDNVFFGDHLASINVPWRHATDNWVVHYKEALMNKGRSFKHRIVAPRRANAFLNIAKELEDKFCNSPAVTNDTDPYGLFYWIVKNATQGFNGGLPSGHTTVGGVNLTQHPNFKNYTDTYSDWTPDDLFYNIRQALLYMNWRTPIDMRDFRKGAGRRLRIYCDFQSHLKLGNAARNQNDQNGADLAMYDDEVTIQRHRFTPLAKLNDESDSPFYMVDLGCFMLKVLSGVNLREFVQPSPNYHGATETHVDLTYNYICGNRRYCGVIYKV